MYFTGPWYYNFETVSLKKYNLVLEELMYFTELYETCNRNNDWKYFIKNFSKTLEI